MLFPRRWTVLYAILCCFLFVLYQYKSPRPFHLSFPPTARPLYSGKPIPQVDLNDGRFHWANVPQRHPVTSLIPLPSGKPHKIPKIQHQFGKESTDAKKTREERLRAVKKSFEHAWQGYKKNAWLSDEVGPLSGRAFNHFGGWAATLVDALDTLWIMELYDEFEDAVDAIQKIDFSSCALEELNVFETTIRYLGGFMAAYDLSEGKYPVLLAKAMELGEMLYVAFDTPNRMPVTRWNWISAAKGDAQEASTGVLVAEVGSLSLEFTRLSQLTGDNRYFDAIQRITDHFEEQQNRTYMPGMWPVLVNLRDLDLTKDSGFTIGAMADSLYEYLPKEHMLLGGLTPQYENLYQHAIEKIKKYILYRPMTPENHDILLAGQVRANEQTQKPTEPQGQHLACFAGGMLGMGAKVFNRPDELVVARKLVDGCIWAYESMPLGVMPEVFYTVPCASRMSCQWDEEKWKAEVNRRNIGAEPVEQKIKDHRLPPGFAQIPDKRYILRPEAIESIFILYRITGDPILQEKAWVMFNTITRHSLTGIANAALDDITVAKDPPKADRMESFWLAETLKYFYLIFSEPGVVSLDDWVLNTEAHPFRRPS